MAPMPNDLHPIGTARRTRDQFSKADFTLLRDCLEAVQGRFILTINDRPETRALFAGGAFHIESVGVTYRLNGHPTEARELIKRRRDG
jgi:DNA adenine methylase